MPPTTILLAATIAVLPVLMTRNPEPNAHPEPNRPLIVAHRGASADAPENTLAAFDLAWQQGADAIEGDFHLTRDRQIVCTHDSDTRKVASQSLSVVKTRLSELKQLDVGSWKSPEFADQRIPTFAEVLATVPPRKTFYIELKSSPRIVRPLLKQIDQSGVDPQQLVVISFSARVLKKLKTLRPKIAAYLLAEPAPGRRTGQLKPSVDQLLRSLRRSRADGISVGAHPALDQTFANAFLDAGYSLHVWTVDDPQQAARWSDLGARSITTNKPALLLERL